MEQLDSVTNNLANVNTDGFKKSLIKEMSQRLDENGGDANHLLVFPRFRETLIDRTQGPLRQTGNPLDLGLEGDGYFVVQTPANDRFLTRSGHFYLNEEGYLVDRNGNLLLSDKDKPIQVDPRERIDVTQEGGLYQKGELVAKIQLQNYEEVTLEGETYYLPKGNATEVSVKVRQGYLESSNVNPIEEMSEMIVAQRRFEMYNNIIKSLDQLNQKTNEIGKA